MRRTWLVPTLMLVALSAVAQDGNLTGQVNVIHESKRQTGSADAVVWLVPYTPHPTPASESTVRLVQRNKQFSPHILVVLAGTTIEFPNQDPFFHDVFSIYHGKPFDLGLYESGSTRRIRFTKIGLSYLFCNIHPDMSAVVLTLQTPYFTKTTADGHFQIGELPPGRYKFEIWHELVSEEELAALSHDVEISAGENSTGAVTIHSSDKAGPHANKYGEPYATDKTLY